MTASASIKCPRCGVTVPLDKIDMPSRCMADCPLDGDRETESRRNCQQPLMKQIAADLERTCTALIENAMPRLRLIAAE